MRPLIAGNWKMHGLAPQLAQIEAIAASVKADPPRADVLVCVPATLIARAAQVAAGRIAIGGENCAAAAAGAFTGDVSADMLVGAGATAVIIGHSERRRLHDETDADVAAKAEAAWRAGLATIICIGETGAQRRVGGAQAICAAQIDGSVPEGMAGAVNAIGYEPLWAIGSGRTPDPEEIVEMHGFIRERLVGRLGAEGKRVRILYGGSVKPANAVAILALAEVGGALVGGASLEAGEFEAIIRAAPAARAPAGDALVRMRAPAAG